MNLVEEALTNHWGPKCSEYEAGCIVCDAWREYENLVTYGTSEPKEGEEMKPWKEFNRMHMSDNFYGCVAPDGEWFDSGMTYTTAVTHCCYYAGQFDLSIEGEALWMNDEGAKLGYSVIHSSMIKQMYEKGLIK